MGKSRSLNTNQVAVAQAAIKLCASNGQRNRVTITNNGAAAIAVGGSSTVTATTGHQIAPGASQTYESYVGELWAIAASGTNTTSVSEEWGAA